ncbi:MAG: XRE family transcriptional regulator [Motiliproteus sp.]
MNNLMNQAILSHSDLVLYHRDQYSASTNDIDLGKRLFQLRTEQNRSMPEIARAAGLSARLLQKIESGVTSPRIEQLQPVLATLGVSLDALCSMRNDSTPLNRRVITPVNTAGAVALSPYQHRLLCAELLHKKMLPLTSVLKSSENKTRKWEKHEGEVLLYVLLGRVTLVGELYQPLLLEPGDSVYFDGMMPYQLYNAGDADAEVVWSTSVC